MWRLDKKLFIFSSSIYAFQGLTPILIAFLTGQLIDFTIAASAGTAGLMLPLSMLAALAATQVLFSHSFNMQYYITIRLRKVFSMYLAEKVFDKFQQLDHNHYEDSTFNKLANKITYNVNVISLVPERTLQLLTRVLQLVATTLAIIVLSPSIVLLLFVSIIPLVVTLMKTARARWQVWDWIDNELRLRNYLGRTLQNVDEVNELKIFKLSTYFRALWRKYYSRTEDARIDVERHSQKRLLGSSVFEGLIQFGIGAILLLRVVRNAAFSLGDFEFYRRLVADFSNASGQMASGFQSLSESNLFLHDYRDFIALKPQVKHSKKPTHINEKVTPRIEFRDVGFKYPKSNKYVLRHLNMIIEPGDDIALVGANGAGKTTIIKLLMRFYDVSEGEILVDNINIRDTDISQWYKQVGALFQQFNKYPYLKVKRSIGVGDVARVDDIEGIQAASEKAGAHAYIDKLPHKYDTVLTKVFDDGTDLSGGEWQRVALARAFFRDANILILDEPTSAVDAKAEYEIFERINATQKEKTTIIISHRFSTVRNADKIYVIDDGKIVEAGSHEELMKQSGMYHELFETQAQGYR
ncbi:MAG: ABC transporter ATP-binding protein [Candidatus Saccharimonadales bacterium]